MRVCATPGCGQVIPAQKGSARPRKYCTTCRPPRKRTNPRVIKLPGAEAAQQPPEQHPEQPAEILPELVAAYRKQLDEADRLTTPDGAHVMLLAGLLAAGAHTASGAASLSRELRAAMEVALRGAPRQADRLDELADRRHRKASGA